MSTYTTLANNLREQIETWEPKFMALTNDQISTPRNNQYRNIRQIVGHMVDSASNNTHRIIHLQYQGSPVQFPDYANLGNNDKWIAIQNYQYENWEHLVNLWKYTHLHICHVMEQVDDAKLEQVWISALDEKVSLKDMIEDFPNHFKLHIAQIEELIDKV